MRPAPGQPLAGQPRAAQQEPHQRRLGRAPPAEPPRAASQGQRRPQQRQDVRLLAAPRRPVRHLPQQLLDVRAAVAASPTGCRHQRASLVPHRVPSPPDGFPSAQRARHPRRKAPVVLPMRLVAKTDLEPGDGPVHEALDRGLGREAGGLQRRPRRRVDRDVELDRQVVDRRPLGAHGSPDAADDVRDETDVEPGGGPVRAALDRRLG